MPVQAGMHPTVHLHLTCRYFFNLYITTVLFSLLWCTSWLSSCKWHYQLTFYYLINVSVTICCLWLLISMMLWNLMWLLSNMTNGEIEYMVKRDLPYVKVWLRFYEAIGLELRSQVLSRSWVGPPWYLSCHAHFAFEVWPLRFRVHISPDSLAPDNLSQTST